jgi:cysteine desulfurase
MTDRTYLDWNATARLRPEARAAVLASLDIGGNPSSVHGVGRMARRTVEQAREEVAALVGVTPREVIFTSGGTEANALALTPALGDVLLVSAIEHPSVLGGGRFATVQDIAVTSAGEVDLEALRKHASDTSRPLVSIMLANNEAGVVQPVVQAAEIVHAAGGLLHVDAVQGPGRIACDFRALGADLMTLSAHKLGGPQGVGALIKREALDLDPQIRGGGQERGARAGTENVPGIGGFGAAARAVRHSWRDEAARMAALRDRLETGLKAIAPQAVIFGEAANRLPNTTLFAVPGVKAETAVISLDLEGVAASSGAACSSGKVTPSHVLAAMGIDAELIRGAIRLSLGYSTTEAEIEAFLKAWAKLAEGLYKSRNQQDIAA